jgi:hypothetical protein
MRKAIPVALAGMLVLSMAAWMPGASAQSHRHSHEDHEGISYVITSAGAAMHIKNRTNVESSMIVHMETTKANNNAVSFKIREGELKVGDDSYSIKGGKASLAVKSGRLSMTAMLEDDKGKVQLLRMTASMAGLLPHEDEEETEISFKVSKVLRFWKLDMNGQVALSQTERQLEKL